MFPSQEKWWENVQEKTEAEKRSNGNGSEKSVSFHFELKVMLL